MSNMDSPGETAYYRLEENDGSTVNIRDYLLILLKRRWLILSILVIAIAGTAVYCLKQTPLYRSRSILYFENRGFEFLQGLSPAPTKLGEPYINSQTTILRSKALAIRVIDEVRLSRSDLTSSGYKEKPADFKLSEIDKNAIANELSGLVQILPVPETNLVHIIFLTSNPELSKILANAWADEFREYSGSSDFEMTQQAEELLSGEVKTLQTEIAEKQKLLRDFSVKKDVFKLKGDVSIGEEYLRSLNVAFTDATRDRIAKEVTLREIRTRPKESLPQLSSSSMLHQLQTELSNLERTYADKQRLYKPDYPEMMRLQAQIDRVKERITQEMNTTYSRAVLIARSDYNEALYRENQLRDQLEQIRKQAAEGYLKEIDYDQLKQEIDNKKSLLTSLLQKRNQAGVSAQVQEKMPTIIKVIERAEAPTTRYSPNIKRMMLFSVLFGLIAGIVFALLIEFLDRSLKSPDDVEKYVQVPLLGVVPQFIPTGEQRRALPTPVSEEGNGNLPDHRRARDLSAWEESQSVTSEALRTLRTSLLLSFPSGPPQSILVTSSRPGEGKTFIASNLAVTLSQLNKKIVLVDADLRNPRIHKVWGLQNSNGLTNFLTTQVTHDNVVQPSTDPKISVITSGSKSPRPAELLASNRFDELIQELSKEYDHVIIDSPPLLPVTDSVLLAAKTNTVLLVIRGGETPRDLVLQAKKKLMKCNPVIAGAVLNCINLQDPYYYYSYYSYYKEYYGERSQNPTPPVSQES